MSATASSENSVHLRGVVKRLEDGNASFLNHHNENHRVVPAHKQAKKQGPGLRAAMTAAFAVFIMPQNDVPQAGAALGLSQYPWVTVFGIVVMAIVLLLLVIRSNRRNKTESDAKLEELKTQNRSFHENPLCGYFTVEDDGIVADLNTTMAELLGYDRGEVRGKLGLKDLIARTGMGLFENKFGPAEDQLPSSSQKMNLTLIKKNGSFLPVVLGATPLLNRGRGYQKWLFTIVDKSEIKEAQEKIQNLNQELEAFTYSVSHDLRAPLRSIDGYSRILQEDYGEKLDDEGRRVLNVIMANAKRMGKLIDDLLDFARLGRKVMHRSKINMTGMVNNIVRELVMQEPDRKMDVTVKDLHIAFADVDMIRQVWICLLENAIKYTGKNAAPSIEISSYPDEDGHIWYKVKDNGVGFDMKYASKLFGVFQRLHKMQDFGGTGVGLAIVKRIVSRHEGRVSAEGSLNKGAIFYFSIPNANGNE